MHVWVFAWCVGVWTVGMCSSITLASVPAVSVWSGSEQSGGGDGLGTRVYIDFDDGWRFLRGDHPLAAHPEFDDTTWREVDLPHDWSSEGPFGPEFASGTGYAPGGIGWYRKRFTLADRFRAMCVGIEFDGIYNNAQVWINGHFVGARPYGYSSFRCELTPFLRFGTNANVVAVRVDHSKYADSRWYTGSGIYRHVRLCITPQLHVTPWGVFVQTPEVQPACAVVRVQTEITNAKTAACGFVLESAILDPEGRQVARLVSEGSIPARTNQILIQHLRVPEPDLWSVDTPRLYTLCTRLQANDGWFDYVRTRFGIRTIRFDPDAGFFLNGRPLKLKGVCLHHDAGCLGAAVPEKVWERRLRTLREIGVNAIRTSHNPPAPELLDLCDRLGFLVMVEAFDEFTPAKKKWVRGWNVEPAAGFGYAEVFEQWAECDLADMIRRDRNHPSIILWSIGNEIDYPNDPFSHPVLGDRYIPESPPAEKIVELARPLIMTARRLDPTRPVTMALAHVGMSEAVGLPELLDVVGYNYQESRYAEDHARYPQRIILGSETSHRYADWVAVRDNPYVAGQFLWTGVDYLGEARAWPNRANGSGLLDLCGFKKPMAWFRQSLWSDRPMVYLCATMARGRRGPARMQLLQEHWNWPTNTLVTVHCFTTCTEVELLLNNRSIGRRARAETVDGALTWDVNFEQGTLRAVGLEAGIPVAEFELRTAGPPAKLKLIADTSELRAGARDICHVEFQIQDSGGVRVPLATNRVTFEVTGPAEILGIENGDLNSPEPGRQNWRSAFRGRGLVILRSGRAAGTITLTASSPGLASDRIILICK